MEKLTSWLDLISFILLAYPGVTIARMSAKADRFVSNRLNEDDVDPFFIELKKEVGKDLWTSANQWKPIHNISLWLGLIIATSSQILKIIEVYATN
jgi:hypothetical protein